MFGFYQNWIFRPKFDFSKSVMFEFSSLRCVKNGNFHDRNVDFFPKIAHSKHQKNNGNFWPIYLCPKVEFLSRNYNLETSKMSIFDQFMPKNSPSSSLKLEKILPKTEFLDKNGPLTYCELLSCFSSQFEALISYL